MFDFNEVVQFKYDTAEYTLNLPWAILDNKLPNVRKLFKFMSDSNDTEHEAAKKNGPYAVSVCRLCIRRTQGSG